MASNYNCPHCHRPLIEIDRAELPENDFEALSNLSDARHKAEDTTP
jgi:transcription initiation factor IIE alpha subunit